MKLSEKVLSFFFPHKCTFCRKVIDYKNNTFICKDCLNTLPYIHGTTCIKCNRPISDTALSICYNCRHYKYSFEKSFTPMLYKEKGRNALLAMKFYNKENFCRSFAFLIGNYILSSDYPQFDFITYVPLSSKALSNRGYNQCKIIADELSKILHLPVYDTLYRINGTPKQSSLTFKERRKNAKVSFFSKDVNLKGTALLIDDIYTTGSTADYCSKLLLKMGCDKVYIATVALKTKD